MKRNPFSTKGIAAEAALIGMMAVGVAMGSAGIAAADPEPVPPPPPPSPGAHLLQGEVDPNAIVDAPPPADPAVTALGPLGALGALGGTGNDFMLGQNPVPQVGGAGAAPPSADILQSGSFLLPQNYRVPPPDQDSPYALAEGVPGPFARVDGIKGAHSMFHGALGRMPIGELGQPLPGTSPPPGTNIPVGPVDGLPDPGAPPPGILPPLPPLGG
jgi:hypothetical protein